MTDDKMTPMMTPKGPDEQLAEIELAMKKNGIKPENGGVTPEDFDDAIARFEQEIVSAVLEYRESYRDMDESEETLQPIKKARDHLSKQYERTYSTYRKVCQTYHSVETYHDRQKWKLIGYRFMSTLAVGVAIVVTYGIAQLLCVDMPFRNIGNL